LLDDPDASIIGPQQRGDALPISHARGTSVEVERSIPGHKPGDAADVVTDEAAVWRESTVDLAQGLDVVDLSTDVLLVDTQ
jgi:hypothetical protein